MRLRLLMGVLAAAFLVGCPENTIGPVSAADEAKMAVDKRLAGSWRVTSYRPVDTLSQALLAGLQDKIVVSFDNGRVRSMTPGLHLDRKYRLEAQSQDMFRVFITDDTGVEYESWGRFDAAGRVLFETKTQPWKGSGVLEREGPAIQPRQ